jgi:acetylornithine deacetylase/succinyl-diaminopimelate desuccinylase-like protein
MLRAGHLVAERIGKRAGKNPKRLLLLGHFDTVFEGEGQKFVRTDSIEANRAFCRGRYSIFTGSSV